MPSGFPYFLQFKSEFWNKDLMIWATVSSRSCCCCSPSSNAKNINNLISVLTILSMCRVISCVVGKGSLLWPVCSLDKTLLAFALLHCVRQGQTCLLFQVSLDFQLSHSSPLWWKGHLSLALVLGGLVGLHRTTSSSSVIGAQTWITVILNGMPWKWTEIILSFLRLHPSTTFQTLLLAMRAIPFLLRSFAHSRYNGHMN